MLLSVEVEIGQACGKNLVDLKNQGPSQKGAMGAAPPVNFTASV